jgi:N-glycosidase YbiA
MRNHKDKDKDMRSFLTEHFVEIRFYLKRDPYGCFSNFAPYPVEIGGRIWKTTEHYYQAQKYAGTEYEEIIANLEAPFRAKMMAKKEGLPKRKDWYDIKFDVMMTALTAKFGQYSALRDILVSTGSAILKEHTELDHYWGDGGDGSGRSRLGEALMILKSSYPEYEDLFFEPPWLVFPGQAPDAGFWTTSSGREYLNKYQIWFRKLSPDAGNEYLRYFVPPDLWSPRFDRIIRGQ